MSNASPGHELLTTNRKALVINLDESRYGTFAEIGAGQEVARHFFQAGGAAGTIAKTISAYDMAFSDAIYGRSPRYVSGERLHTMLDHEYELLRERLAGARSGRTRFFVFADTVAARSYRGTNECHGWLGVRFQAEPLREPNDILVHVRMWDRENILQQQAVGILGVNLLYGAFYQRDEPENLVQSLIDGLSTERIEVDLVQFRGPDLAGLDQRQLALRLVERGMTNAALFTPAGEPVLPSDVLRKNAVLVQRGSFHPVTRVNLDLMRAAGLRFEREEAVAGRSVLPLFEMSTPKLAGSGSGAGGAIDAADVLARVDTLGAVGMHVMVSNYSDYFRLTAYFRRYTPEMIGFVMGVRALGRFLDERSYDHLDGGILEAFGRLFKSSVRVYVYPQQQRGPDGATTLLDATNVPVPANLRHLHRHLLENGLIEPLTEFDPAVLGILAREALRGIRSGDAAWESLVPEAAAKVIRSRRLFGLPGG